MLTQKQREDIIESIDNLIKVTSEQQQKWQNDYESKREKLDMFKYAFMPMARFNKKAALVMLNKAYPLSDGELRFIIQNSK